MKQFAIISYAAVGPTQTQFDIHKAGCADIERATSRREVNYVEVVTGESAEQAAREFWDDAYGNDGSAPEDQVPFEPSWWKFEPCTKK